MSQRVTLRCHACEQTFAAEYGPGRPAMYCSGECRTLARRIRRRMRFVEQVELRSLRRSPS